MSIETIQKVLPCTGKSFDGMAEKDLSGEGMCEWRTEEQEAASRDIWWSIMTKIFQVLPRNTVMNKMRQCPSGAHSEYVLLTNLGKIIGNSLWSQNPILSINWHPFKTWHL